VRGEDEKQRILRVKKIRMRLENRMIEIEIEIEI
jgi:hypothetical protein